MSLDPSVITQAKSPDIASQVSQFASAASSFQSIKNQQAALPGIQADSAIKQRAAQFQQWIKQNGGQFVSQPLGEDGKPQTGAQPTVDHAGLVKAAADAGFLPEAQSVAAADLANQASVLNNKSQAINNATNSNALAVSARGYVSTFMDAYQKANPNATPDDLTREYNKNLTGVQHQLGQGLSLQAVFGQPDVPPTKGPNGQPTQPLWKYDPIENKAMMTATMSPQVQQELANSKETLAQAGVTGQSGPEYRSMTSNVTKQAQAAAIAIDPAHKDIYSGMSAAQLAKNETVGGAVMASLNPQGARVAGATGFIQHVNQGKVFGNAADALETFKSKLPADEQQQFLSAPAAWLQNKLGKFSNDKDLTAAGVALQNAIIGNPTMNLSTMDAGSLAAALRKQQAVEYDQAGTYGAQATASTNAGVVEAAGGKPSSSGGTGKTNPAPNTQNSTERVKVTKDGKTGTIPASQLKQALANGYTQVK